VSGDYYDCLQLDAQRVALAAADISGKGISAALLMASLNAALRSLILSLGASGVNTAALAERLNRHLLLNTSDDRYATFFLAVYDTAAPTLNYTNAGHLPPFLILGDCAQKLDRGGPVIGLLNNCNYEQVSMAVEPGSLRLLSSRTKQFSVQSPLDFDAEATPNRFRGRQHDAHPQLK
jgi:phosphoserine phosphatase RsbU/P